MKKVILLGGDTRLKCVESLLKAEGYSVETLGLYPDDKGDIASADIVIFPVPTTKDGVNVHTPLTSRVIPLKDAEDCINEKAVVLCCNYKTHKGIKCIDYNSLDSYALLNAVPTAEGAIKIATENTPFTLWKSRVLVIGYGRVGKVLAHRLRGMGCYVTVSVRKPADFALLDALDFENRDTRLLNDTPLDYDIIFNTVDFPVLNEKTLQSTDCKLIIDLSSKGGFDLKFAKKNGICAIKAPGLPGITAPETAGKILAETVKSIIEFN